MAVVRKKQDDKNLKILREIVTLGGGNRQCFDCGQKGPTYVNMTIGSFICTRCSGVLRGLTPPHRVKSISMATFSPDEIEFVKTHGNDVCAKTWLGLWDPKRIIHQDQRELMIDKYERKRYYLEPASPLKSLTNATNVSNVNGNNNLTSNISSSNIKNAAIDSSNKNIAGLAQSSNNAASSASASAFWLPANTKTSNSSMNSNNSNHINNNSISNRNQTRYNFQNQFAPDDNNFFATASNGRQKNKQQSSATIANGIGNSGGLNGTSINDSNSNILVNGLNHVSNLNNRQAINKNSLNIAAFTKTDTNGGVGGFTSNNKFTPDSDFVADFGSANIFNATSANPTSGGGGTLNGFKNQQNGTATSRIQANNFINGARSIAGSNAITEAANANENFADFDHAPIYNAAGFPMPMNSPNNHLASSATFNSNPSTTPSADRYAALKDLDEQLRENKAAAIESFNTPVVSNTAAANPFKVAQPQQIANPFQNNQTNKMFSAPAPQQPTVTGVSVFGSSPAFSSPTGFTTNGYATTGALFNGNANESSCGVTSSYGMQPIATGGIAARNPFATTSMNSNNPFL